MPTTNGYDEAAVRRPRRLLSSGLTPANRTRTSNAPSTAGTGRSWTDAGSPKLRTANARILTSRHWHPSRKYCWPRQNGHSGAPTIPARGIVVTSAAGGSWLRGRVTYAGSGLFGGAGLGGRVGRRFAVGDDEDVDAERNRLMDDPP